MRKQPVVKIKHLFTEDQAYRRNRTEMNSRALNFTGCPRGAGAPSFIRHYLFQVKPSYFHFKTTFFWIRYKKQ